MPPPTEAAAAVDDERIRPALVILAAGAGSRYGGLKQLEAVGPGGTTIMDYTVFDALRAGFGKVVFVIRPKTAVTFRSSVGRRIAGHLPVAYALQRPDGLPAGFQVPPGRSKPWGTAHAVLAAEEAVAGPFAVVNADDFYGADSFVTLSRFLRRREPGKVPVFAMVGFTVRQTLVATGGLSRALCSCTPDGWLRRIVEIPALTRSGDGGCYTAADGTTRAVGGDELVSMNMWGFAPELFGELRQRFRGFLQGPGPAQGTEFLLPSVIEELIREQRVRVKVLPSTGEWCGMTYLRDKQRVVETIARLIARGDYPRKLWP